jgi:hypothetical protein
MSLDLETPLALASFIANNSNLRKVYIPSTFNLTKIMEALKTQHSEVLVCDAEMYGLEPPKEKKSEYEAYAENIKKVVVAGGSSGKS